MRLTIKNKNNKSIETYLKENKRKFPLFKTIKEHMYNGIIIEIEDEDFEEFSDMLDGLGFYFENERETISKKPVWPKESPKIDRSCPKLPRAEKIVPIWPKDKPRIQRDFDS